MMITFLDSAWLCAVWDDIVLRLYCAHFYALRGLHPAFSLFFVAFPIVFSLL